eukprot:g4646.t1
MQRRGPWNELHHAADDGLIDRTVALLSRGAIDIEAATLQGLTPLMLAAFRGHARIVRLLLNKGASSSVVGDDGITALQASAQEGHAAVVKLLVEAGADLEVMTPCRGLTPLYIATTNGHLEVVRVLLEGGANPNTRDLESGATPLYVAAQDGHAEAVKALLQAKADPIAMARAGPGRRACPLDVAAQNGHLGVVRELIQEFGIKGCGGASGGVDALACAAQEQVEVMEMLTNAGVVDTGVALLTAAENAGEAAVKFLLQQMRWTTRRERAAYLNTRGRTGYTPLFAAIVSTKPSSARVVRLLADAGADTASCVLLTDIRGMVFFHDTPLAFTNRFLARKNPGGEPTGTEDELRSLEASRRVLLRLEAVHATSWLWKSCSPSAAHAAGEGTTGSPVAQVASMLSILRQRTRRSRLLLAAMLRHSNKP